MDEEQYMERFSMDGDFVDGQWIDGEFHYRSRKEKRTQTKEEALYGYESESDSDGRRKRRRRGAVIVEKVDLSKPVNFVSTGTVKPSEEQEDENVGEASTSARHALDSELGARPGLGGAGLTSPEDGDENELLPTAFGKRLQERAEQRRRAKETAPNSNQKTSKSKPVLDMPFEKHTRGIGSKLLEKMGYKGGGLGKNAQGIAEPIQTKLRPKNMGMGFNDFREAAAPPPPGTEESEEYQPKERKPKVEANLWKKNKSKSRDYVTAEELLARQQDRGVETVQVLDMRGPQVRVVTNMKNLNAEQVDVEDNTPMPELQHNLRLIVDLVESDIQHYDRKLRHERQTLDIFQKDRDRLQQELTHQTKRLEVMNTIMSTINSVKQGIVERRLTLDNLASIFGKLQVDFPDDYQLCNVSAVALSFVLPLMVAHFHGWEPLVHPSRGIDAMLLWKQLLQGRDYSIFPEADSSPYCRLVMETVMPFIRRSALSWEARDPEPLLRFLEAWEKALPPLVLQNILDQLVMPKLKAQVDAWNPLKDTVPIHAWLHPWLPFLGSKLEPLYTPIRIKLDSALQAWHPSDSSAYVLLSPWQSVFDAASWEQLLLRSIIPKLMFALHELVINPAHQQLAPFNWVMSWSLVVPIHHMVGMLEAGFFPKWQQVLYHWLLSNPNFDEVTQWYQGWKSILPPELLANDRIRWQLNAALDMMNQAVEGAPLVQPGARENLSYLRSAEQRHFESQKQQQQQGAAPKAYAQQHAMDADEAEMSLKEVVESFAQDNDVQFLPKVGRVREGLQVYGFGTISISVDSAKQVILAQSGDRWTSVSLEQLLKMHHAKIGGKWK